MMWYHHDAEKVYEKERIYLYKV